MVPANLQAGQWRNRGLRGSAAVACCPIGQFVPLGDPPPTAEESGIIVPIGLFVLEQVCRQLNSWAETMPDARPTIDVNLSLRQFSNPQTVGSSSQPTAKWKVSPGQLRLEKPRPR